MSFARSGLVLAALMAACGPVQRGPFIPPGAKICRADPDCPRGTTCRFPGVDLRPVCMPGENEVDALADPPRMP
jgi:hypothetical protein